MGTRPESMAWLLPLKGTAGGDVLANTVISANTEHRATY